MKNQIDEKQFEKITEIIHLHFCKDSYITSNDFNLLLSEYHRNNRLNRIIGYVSPYTRFPKVLRQYIYGLDYDTQKRILDSIKSLYLEKNSFNISNIFSKNLYDIKINNDQFYDIFILPLLENHRSVFSRVGICDLKLGDSADNLHQKFLDLSNEVYKLISKNFDFPLLELRSLDNTQNYLDKIVNSDHLKALINQKLSHQQKYVENVRFEYRKAIKGYHGDAKYHHKKRVIERYDRDVFRSIKRKYFISDYDLINFIESESNDYYDLFEIDRTITKNLVKADITSDNSNSLKYLGTKILLDKIFATKPEVIITQKFTRNFDYNLYSTLSEKYNVGIYPSSVTTWKEDKNLRFRKTKLMSFIYGLDLFFNEYVR